MKTVPLLLFLCCLAATQRKGAQILMELARPAGVKSATHGRVASQQAPSAIVLDLPASEPANINLIPIPIPATPKVGRVLIPPTPPSATSVYQWDIPAWLPYQFNPAGAGTNINLQPQTWLERVTRLGDTNWARCSSNVPITILTRSASAVVTNLPVYFLRPAYGWPKF